MGVSIMRVEARDGRYHIALAACLLGILILLVLIIGVAGPQQTGYQVNSSYNCTSSDDHTRGNDVTCAAASCSLTSTSRPVPRRRGPWRGPDI